MQMNVAGLRRNLKNVAHNYTDAQVKVREATSNDPSMPPNSLLAEIADLTYNVMAYSEIMTMVWKRLNDHGKNWRHVYKALTLLEYLVKSGSEKVLLQCRDNKFAIQTLVDFQYYEESKDQGLIVRERAKALMVLLNDEEKLKNERAKALKIKERLARSLNGFGSEGVVETLTLSPPTSPSERGVGGNWSSAAERASAEVSREIESARPQTIGEEELQLQLALAMSREEAEQEEQRRKSDDVRLQLALSQSQHQLKPSSPPPTESHLLDLLDVNLGAAAPAPAQSPVVDPWGLPKRPQIIDPWGGASSAVNPPTIDPWASNQRATVHPPDPWAPPRPASHSPALAVHTPGLTSVPVHAPPDPWAPPRPLAHSPAPPDPWAPPRPAQPVDAWAPARTLATPAEPWRAPAGVPSASGDPWSPTTDHSPMSPPEQIDDFDIISNRDRHANNVNNNGVRSPDVFDLSGLDDILTDKSAKKTPHAFLGENSALVNLENLVSAPKPAAPIQSAFVANPFGTGPAPVQNLFQQQVPPRPTLNQMSRPEGQSISPPNPFLS